MMFRSNGGVLTWQQATCHAHGWATRVRVRMGLKAAACNAIKFERWVEVHSLPGIPDLTSGGCAC